MSSVVRLMVVVAVVVASLTARAAEITITGSDTMVPLGQRWAEEYTRAHPGTAVKVTGGGSSTGISALIEGTTAICQASRSMNAAEQQQMKDRHGAPVVEIPVARDGLSVFVHASNPLNDITVEQLKLIFTGRMTNWKELGGPDAKILVFVRDNKSGTYAFFKEHVMSGADYAPGAQTFADTAAVVKAVSKEQNGIGYGGAAYAKGMKVLRVKKDSNSPAVAPDAPHVKDGSYPLSRSLFFYLRSKPTGEMAAFVNWVLSPAGQKVVINVGYYSGGAGFVTKVGYYSMP